MKRRSLVIGVLASVVIAAPAPATDFTWTGSFNTLFQAPLNWSPFTFGPPAIAGPPDATEMGTFDLGNATYTVTFNASHTSLRTRIGDDAVTFNLGGFTFHNASTTNPAIALGYGLGAGDQPSLTLTNGTLSGKDAHIAAVGGLSSASMTVGSGATLNLTGHLSVGRVDTGALTIMSGGDALCATAAIGESFVANPLPSTGNGTATVTGNGSYWRTFGALTIGNQGVGTLNISDHAQVRCHDAFVAALPGSSGTVSAGWLWQVHNNLYVGGSATAPGGNATLTVLPGGNVQVSGLFKLWPGGHAIINGGALSIEEWAQPYGDLQWISGTLSYSPISGVNLDQSGPLGPTLTLDATRDFSTSLLWIGDDSPGSMALQDGGTCVAVGISIGGNAEGVVTINDGGELRFYEWLGVGGVAGVQSSLVVNGGHITVPFPPTPVEDGIFLGTAGTATVDVLNGGFVFCHSPINFGGAPSGWASVVVDGVDSVFGTSEDMFIGEPDFGGTGGGGILTVQNNALALAELFRVGDYFEESPGELVVRAGGTVQGDIMVGRNGSLSGDGIVTGGVGDYGIVAPGDPIGTLTIGGEFVLDTTFDNHVGILEIEIGGPLPGSQHDQLLVDGDVTLDGELHINLVENFVPQAGQEFTLIESANGGISGAFTSITPAKSWEVIYLANMVVARAVVDDCPADIAPSPNGDNAVNVSDLLAVINGWGGCSAPCPPYCAADVDDNCQVNVTDLLAVINAWGPCP